MRFVDQNDVGFRLRWATVVLTFVCGMWSSSPRSLFASPALQQQTSAPTGGVIVADARVNLRGGPGMTYLILAKIEPGATVTVLAYNPAEDWIRIRVDSTGRTGWVAANLVQLSEAAPAPLLLLPTPTPDPVLSASTPATGAANQPVHTEPSAPAAALALDPTAPPVAVTQPANMNVRGGPGTHYPVVSTVRAGSALPIVALGPNRDWYKVDIAGLDEAWIAASLAQSGGALDTLTVVADEQLPPPPAPPAAPASVAAAPTAPSPAVGDAPPPSGGGFFAYGIQAHLWQNSEKQSIAGQIHGIGFTWVKQQLRWEFMEDSPGHVNWSEADQVVDVMHGNGFNILYSVFTAPQWSRPDKPGTGGPPNDFNLFADFVGKVAGRYCGRVQALEIWNEQNLQREWEGFPIDPALYMDLLRRSYTAAKNSCPSMLIISGAPTPAGNTHDAVDDVEYLRGMYAHGLARYSDGIGVHPSGFANPPEVTVQDWQAGRYTPPPSHFDHRSFYFRSTMEEYRNVMVANGDVNKRLWPTEFGWGSSPTPYPGYEYQANITESAQAQYIVRAYLLMREWGWVAVPFLWNLNFSEGEMATFRVAGRPAYEALKSLPK